MMQDRNVTDDLLVNYLLGEATGEEQGAVEAWLGVSASNRDRFHTLRLLWEQSAAMGAYTGIPASTAWERFEHKRAISRKTSARRWAIAASLLALISITGLTINTLQHHKKADSIASMAPTTSTVQPKTVPVSIPKMPASEVAKAPVPENKPIAHMSLPIATKKIPAALAVHPAKSGYKKLICNNTPCPFEICIIQKVSCNNDHASEFSTCSVLQPDQSGQLQYKAFRKSFPHCKASIDEIRITRINTGEVIVLNDHSTPSTAQDFFNHLTGKEKGAIVAGKFHSDCANVSDDCLLAFDSRYGNLVLE